MRVLLDTSVWISHFRQSNPCLVKLLESELVVSDEFVVAELACGSLKFKAEILVHLNELVALQTVFTREVILLIESKVL